MTRQARDRADNADKSRVNRTGPADRGQADASRGASSGHPARVQHLHNLAGNQQVQQLTGADDNEHSAHQSKLAVNEPGDSYEQEADRIADQVIGTSTRHSLSGTSSPIDRLSEQSTGQLNGAPASVDKALADSGRPLEPAVRRDMEQRLDLDVPGVRVHTGPVAARSADEVAANAYTVGRHIVFGPGQYAPDTRTGRRLLAHELVHTAQQGSANTLHREPSGATPQPELKRFAIKIPAGISTLQQFLRYVEVQVFGRVINLNWKSTAPALDDPAKNIGTIINVDIPASSLEKFGRPDGSGTGPAEQEEANIAYQGLVTEEKEAIDLEIDRRYYESTQEVPGTKIESGETGKAVIWNSLKQAVLADRRKLEQLPETVKSVLGQATFRPENYKILTELGETLSRLSEDELKAFFLAGPDHITITPAEYPRLLSIAKKLDSLPPEARKDYLDRVNAPTASLTEMEQSIDRYVQFRAEREKQAQDHETAAKPLLGGEDVYTAYRNYKASEKNVNLARSMKGAAGTQRAEAEESYLYLQERLRDAETSLSSALEHKDFTSVAEFEKAIKSYRIAFRTQAVNLALDVLARYEHMLFEERKRLEQGVAVDIAQGIGATRASEHYKEYRTQKEMAASLQFAGEPKETWWIEPHSEAKRAAASAKASAEKDVLRGAKGSPLIQERGIDLEKLADASPAEIQSYLTAEITEREANIKTAREELREDPDRVFTQQELVAATYKILNVEPGTIYGRIINDYIEDKAHKKLLSSIAKGVLAVALAFVPVGGWIGTAALVSGAALGVHEAYTALKEYQQQERDYELGFIQKRPSLFWVGLAIVGAAAEIGIAAKELVKQSASAIKALKKPMLDFAKDGDAPTLLAKIEAAEGLDLKFKAALTRELKASTAAKESWKELFAIGSRVGGFAGMVDPGVVKHLFRALYYSVKRGVNTITKLSADAKFLGVAGDITKMSGADRAQLAAAFEEVKALRTLGVAKGMDEHTLVNFVDRWAINRGKPGFQTKLLDEMAVWKPLTAEQRSALNKLEAQRREVDRLYDVKQAAQEELSELRLKQVKTPADKAEIRELEREIEELDPKAIPGKKPSEGIGKIADALLKLERVEKEAAKAQLSLYNLMRNSRPSYAAREGALKSLHVEDIASPPKFTPRGKEVDHIVPVREISDMDGFADLPFKDQTDIVNMKQNLIAMDKFANASKGDRTWKSWNNASNYYTQETIDAMAKREADVRALISEEIEKRLELLKMKP